MQLVEPEQIEPRRPAQSTRPLRAATVVIYGTLALLAIAIPQGLVNWLGDMNGNPVEAMLLRGAEAVQTASDVAGIGTLYKRARRVFIALSGTAND